MRSIAHLTKTNDKRIRIPLRFFLNNDSEKYRTETGLSAKLFEEFPVSHGAARIDFALVNGIMHGFEIKSDLDSLDRLPNQIMEFNNVFDKITLVVGKRHLYNAVNVLPDYWGIILVKQDNDKNIFFQKIREPEINHAQELLSIARLLWKNEAVGILEEIKQDKGVRSKPCNAIYERLITCLDGKTLKEKVRDILLISRQAWKADELSALCGGLLTL